MAKLIFVDLENFKCHSLLFKLPVKIKRSDFLQLIIIRKKQVFDNYSQKGAFAEANLGN